MSDIGLREPTPEKLRASADAPGAWMPPSFFRPLCLLSRPHCFSCASIPPSPSLSSFPAVPITFRAGGALTFGPRTPHAHPEQPSPADSPIKQETSAEVSPSRALPDAASALSPVSHRDLATPRGSDRAALEDSGDEEGCPEGSTAEGSVGGAEAEGARSMAWRGHRGSAFTARDVDRTGEDAGYGYGYDLDRDGDGVDDSEMARECEDLDGALSWGAPPRHRGQPVPLPRQVRGGQVGECEPASAAATAGRGERRWGAG